MPIAGASKGRWLSLRKEELKMEGRAAVAVFVGEKPALAVVILITDRDFNIKINNYF